VERGDVDQMSFAFWTNPKKVTWETLEDGTLLRTIHEDGIEDLPDVSPVTYPAYPDTDVALRQLERFRRAGQVRVVPAGLEEIQARNRAELEAWKLEVDRALLDLQR
jgi:phage head maturation protease